MRLAAAFAALLCCAPIYAQLAVVNAASSRADQPVSAGSWVSVYPATGTSFPGVSTATAGFPLPTTLGGATVSIDGTAVPAYYSSAAIINIVVPYGIQTGLHNIDVKTGSATVTGKIRIMSTAPGLFYNNVTVAPPVGAIRNEDTTVNSSSNPERRGKVITLYGTGHGPLSEKPADGVQVPVSPLITSTSTPQVYIAGTQAKVAWSGLSPYSVALWQINVTIPDKPYVAGRVPVQIFMDGVDSNEVSLFVAQ